jgi:hypothetical protein
MLTYTTQLKKLVLPEYGRNIQNMVDHCMTIQDRDERTRCAKTIIAAMNVLFPTNGDPEAYTRKLWDHLAIMSDFQLDIDWPYEQIKPDILVTQPDKLHYQPDNVKYRQYGLYLPKMVSKAAAMEEGEDRTALIMLLANQMKKLMLAVNKDGVDDIKIFKDLRLMSNGAISLDPETVHLHDFKQAPVQTTKKKKKK